MTKERYQVVDDLRLRVVGAAPLVAEPSAENTTGSLDGRPPKNVMDTVDCC